MSTTGISTAAQAVTTLEEQTTSAADSTKRPLTTADRCDVCDAHGEKLKEVALLFQDETASLTAGN